MRWLVGASFPLLANNKLNSLHSPATNILSYWSVSKDFWAAVKKINCDLPSNIIIQCKFGSDRSFIVVVRTRLIWISRPPMSTASFLWDKFNLHLDDQRLLLQPLYRPVISDCACFVAMISHGWSQSQCVIDVLNAMPPPVFQEKEGERTAIHSLINFW